ncbi:unnamed protein product [Paramecium sonneborni]|uniref:Uncharacterized protein n=1 Tax=Paramecium sonneborni TaxID=65129 RepID=A0A8S1RG19_9CILI|nr:unnamed protein product [Paramecium sonneborni]
MSDNQIDTKIKLIQIDSINFDAEAFLSCIIYRCDIAQNLIQLLQLAIQNKFIDDHNNTYNLQILKICVVQYNYFQLIQGRNFLNEFQYKGMANQLKKIFIDEKEYKQQIESFKKKQNQKTNQLRQELKNNNNLCKQQQKDLGQEFKNIEQYLKEKNLKDLKFERLQNQLLTKQQINYDIYHYFFKIYYQSKWFKPQNQTIQSIKLQCYITQFLKLDSEYPIQFYQDQMLIFEKIKNDQPLDYYKNIIQQN